MDIEDVRDRWNEAEPSPSAGPEIWDRKSAIFGDMSPAEFGKDSFLDLIDRVCSPDGGTSVLDIGCGTGRYTLALAGKAGKVVGLDFSGEMISKAESKKEASGMDNVSFYVDDWCKERTDEVLRGGFDIVIARFTPAVDTPEALQKMIAVCKGTCFVTLHFGDWNNINQGIEELFHEKHPDRMGRSALFLEYLWCLGYQPHPVYENRETDTWITIEKAFGKHSMGHFRSRSLDEEQEHMVRRYLQSVSENGMVHEIASDRSITLYWDVNVQATFP